MLSEMIFAAKMHLCHCVWPCNGDMRTWKFWFQCHLTFSRRAWVFLPHLHLKASVGEGFGVTLEFGGNDWICSEPFARRGPFTRQNIEHMRCRPVRSTFYRVNRTQAYSLSTSSSEWTWVPFTQQFINWVGIIKRMGELATKNYGKGDLLNWIKQSRNWS